MQKVPDGDYVADIISIDHRVDNKNREIVEIGLQVAVGPLTGTITMKRYYLVTKKVAEFLKKEMAVIHLAFEDKAEFDAKKHLAVGKRVAITAVTNDSGFTNYYFSSEITVASPVPVQASTSVW